MRRRVFAKGAWADTTAQNGFFDTLPRGNPCLDCYSIPALWSRAGGFESHERGHLVPERSNFKAPVGIKTIHIGPM